MGSYPFTIIASNGERAATANIVVTVTSNAPLGFDLEAQQAGSPAAGQPVSIIWKLNNEVITSATSDETGTVSITGLLGSPDDFLIQAGSPGL